jgi:hypothetical protein
METSAEMQEIQHNYMKRQTGRMGAPSENDKNYWNPGRSIKEISFFSHLEANKLTSANMEGVSNRESEMDLQQSLYFRSDNRSQMSPRVITPMRKASQGQPFTLE